MRRSTTASADSLEFVRSSLADLPPVERVLQLGPADLGPRSLVRLTVFLRHLCRDAVLRSATLPARPEWSVLARQAVEVVRTDLVTVAAIADWLDSIEDPATVYAFLLCAHALAALEAEISRRQATGAELAAAYQAIRDDAIPSTLEPVTRALRLCPGPKRAEEASNALALLVEALNRIDGNEDHATWALASPFRSLRPPLPRWDRAAERILDWEMRYYLSKTPAALLVAQVPEEAARTEQTRAREGRARRAILRRQPADISDATQAERIPDPVEHLARETTAGAEKERRRAIQRMLTNYPNNVRLALRAMLRGATDQGAAKSGGLTLRTYQRQKKMFLRKIKELPSS